MKAVKRKGSINRIKANKPKTRVITKRMIFAIGLAIAFPFIIDCMYGKGMLRPIYNNSFPAEVWFSFIGSYFPAAIIGIVTLYQTYIIRCKDKQYEELLARHRFVPGEHAHVYRHNADNRKTGEYTGSDIEKLFMRGKKINLFDEWDKGYIIQCNIYDSSRMEIDCVELKWVDWEINDKKFVQDKPEQMLCVMDRNTWEQYRLTIFCIFDEPDNTNAWINQCMVSAVRGDSDYMESKIVTSLQIKDDAGKKYDLELRFAVQSQKEIHEMKSVTEKILCEVSDE